MNQTKRNESKRPQIDESNQERGRGKTKNTAAKIKSQTQNLESQRARGGYGLHSQLKKSQLTHT